MIAIAPSILAADFAKLGDEVRAAEAGGADRIHVDVMDGHFVPNLSMGPAVVKALSRVTRLSLEVHLMITDPAHYARPFVDAGADRILFHIEVAPDPRHLIESIRSRGASVGLVVNPDTSVELLAPHLELIDLVLCMTVRPGFGGQAFLPGSLDRVRRLRELINIANPICELEVDGGIDLETGRASVAAGATVLVAGTSIFAHPAGPEAGTRAFVEAFDLPWTSE